VIDIAVWFLVVPLLISLHLTGGITLHAPTIGEYIIWQIAGFIVSWLAVHVSSLKR
jgi:hypothetical protein